MGRDCGRGEGGELGHGDVAQVAGDVHRLVVAEDGDDLAPGGRGLALELLEVADDPQRLGPAVGDVAELDEGRLAARPAVGGVDQPGVAGDGEPGGIIAVEVADRDDALRRGLGGKGGGERQGKHERGQIEDKTEQGMGSH